MYRRISKERFAERRQSLILRKKRKPDCCCNRDRIEESAERIDYFPQPCTHTGRDMVRKTRAEHHRRSFRRESERGSERGDFSTESHKTRVLRPERPFSRCKDNKIFIEWIKRDNKAIRIDNLIYVNEKQTYCPQAVLNRKKESPSDAGESGIKIPP